MMLTCVPRLKQGGDRLALAAAGAVAVGLAGCATLQHEPREIAYKDTRTVSECIYRYLQDEEGIAASRLRLEDHSLPPNSIRQAVPYRHQVFLLKADGTDYELRFNVSSEGGSSSDVNVTISSFWCTASLRKVAKNAINHCRNG